MKLILDVKMRMDLIHKTGKTISVDENTSEEIDSKSEEFAELCKTYESKIGFLREEDETKFDKELAKIIVNEAKKVGQERIKEITDVFRKCIMSDTTRGVVSFGGYVLNAREFSGLKIVTFDINIKQEV